MKKIILIALVLTGLTTKAQYFQHLYGGTNDEFGLRGVNITTVGPQGQFMAGVTLSCLPVNTVPAVYTDINGNVPIGGPFFNENYILTNANGNMVANTGFPEAMELTTCGMYGICGSYSDPSIAAPGNTGIFFMQVLPGGTVGAVFNYTTIPGSGFDIVSIGGVKSSVLFPGDWYITGTAVDPMGLNKVFALRINECTGALVWAMIYDILLPAKNAWGADIAENPINPGPFGFPGAAIVGKINDGVSDDAFLFHIDATSGVTAPFPVLIAGLPTSNEEWRSINQAQAGVIPPGFILGGYTNLNGNIDFMVLRMDFLIAPAFFNLFDYSFAPGSDNYCYDVIERLNSACQYEYYAVGNARTGFFGGADVLVVKFDQFGNGVPGGEFTYGGVGNDFGNSLDQRNLVPCGPPMPNFDGLSIFGSTSGSFGPFPGMAAADMYMIKAYYNGISGCNEVFNNPLQLQGFPHNPMMPVAVIHKLKQNTNMLASHYNLVDAPLCFNNIIPGGNNARVAPKDNDGDRAMLLMPNPTATANRDVKLEISSDMEGAVNVEIYDMLGKKYYENRHTVVKGKNILPIDLSTVTMAAGTYSVKMTGESGSKTTILVVK